MAPAGITYHGRDVGQRCGEAAAPGAVGAHDSRPHRAMEGEGSWEGLEQWPGSVHCREAINRLYEAVPGVKGIWKKKVSFHSAYPSQVQAKAVGQGIRGAFPICGPGASWGTPHPLSSFTPGSLVLMSLHCPHHPLPCQAPNKALFSILGKSNLHFAGMSIAVNISVDGLNLMIPTTRQVSVPGHTVLLPASL